MAMPGICDLEKKHLMPHASWLMQHKPGGSYGGGGPTYSWYCKCNRPRNNKQNIHNKRGLQWYSIWVCCNMYNTIHVNNNNVMCTIECVNVMCLTWCDWQNYFWSDWCRVYLILVYVWLNYVMSLCRLMSNLMGVMKMCQLTFKLLEEGLRLRVKRSNSMTITV